MLSQKTNKLFLQKYGESNNEIHSFFSPGRVNLIGEHTDYNGGYVLPTATKYGTSLLIRKTGGSDIKLASCNFEYTATISLKNIIHKQEDKWVNYPLGVVNEFMKKGIHLSGLELFYDGNIPHGAGLSSSASVEVVTAMAINELFDIGLTKEEIAHLSQKAENEFVGVNCGIMDQFAVAMCVQNKALFLNCKTLNHADVPLNISEYKLVIVNTNKTRKLIDSKYNERRSECYRALEFLRKVRDYSDLSEIDLLSFKKIQNLIPDSILRKRALHVISENQRVLDSVKALHNGDIETFGSLMYESHFSLKEKYEVTGIELDTLVETAKKVDGVIGARMTGAGFGGCTVNLVKEEAIGSFQNIVGEEYKQKTGLNAEFILS